MDIKDMEVWGKGERRGGPPLVSAVILSFLGYFSLLSNSYPIDNQSSFHLSGSLQVFSLFLLRLLVPLPSIRRIHSLLLGSHLL